MTSLSLEACGSRTPSRTCRSCWWRWSPAPRDFGVDDWIFVHEINAKAPRLGPPSRPQVSSHRHVAPTSTTYQLNWSKPSHVLLILLLCYHHSYTIRLWFRRLRLATTARISSSTIVFIFVVKESSCFRFRLRRSTFWRSHIDGATFTFHYTMMERVDWNYIRMKQRWRDQHRQRAERQARSMRCSILHRCRYVCLYYLHMYEFHGSFSDLTWDFRFYLPDLPQRI